MKSRSIKVAYVVKWYPRLSETFIVNEILAHEAAGAEVDLFSLLPTVDSHFQDIISRVRAPVTYLPFETPTVTEVWTAVQNICSGDIETCRFLNKAKGQPIHLVYQALVLAKHIHERRITHLHAHFAAIATTVARLAAYLTGIPYSFTTHARDIFHETVDPIDLRQKILDAAAVVTISDFNDAYLRARHECSANRFHRVNYGLDLSRFTFIQPKHRPRIVVAVGRLVEKKGFGILLEACALLVHKDCNFRCQIIGSGVLEPLLRRQIERLGLQERIEMLGARPQREVIQTIRHGALLVAPSLIAKDGDREGLPNVLIEAMALGTPCISTNIVGIPELISHERTGLLVAPSDANGLALAIERLLNDEALQIKLSTEARQKVESYFDIVPNSQRLRMIFADSQTHPDSC